MGYIEILRAVCWLMVLCIAMAATMFGAFLVQRAGSTLLGDQFPTRTVYVGLGFAMIVVNSGLLFFLIALVTTKIDAAQFEEIRRYQPGWFPASIANPFFMGSNPVLDTLGHSIVVFVWWLGMHAFVYAIGLNEDSRWMSAWLALAFALYSGLGPAIMLALLAGWSKLGLAEYKVRWLLGLTAIPISAVLPPVLFRLGLPRFSF
jgi:hypothetical protein